MSSVEGLSSGQVSDVSQRTGGTGRLSTPAGVAWEIDCQAPQLCLSHILQQEALSAGLPVRLTISGVSVEPKSVAVMPGNICYRRHV